MVVMCLTPSCWQVAAQMDEVNWLPRSEVMMAGMPNLAIQLLIRASMQVSVSMEVMGMASSDLLDRSMMVKRYWKPSLETVRGPTKSTWMCEKCWVGTGMGCTAAAGCLVTLAHPHSWKSATQLVMSCFMKGQVTGLPINHPVALEPGCSRLWKAVNSCRR